jgi:hypothetical protein
VLSGRALEVPDDRRWRPRVCGIGGRAAPLACQRPPGLIAGRPPGLGAAAQLKPERQDGSEVVAGQVAASGQQTRPPAGLGADGNTAEVERDDVDIGDDQVPAGSQDARELGHHRAERAHMNERQGTDDQVHRFVRDRQLVQLTDCEARSRHSLAGPREHLGRAVHSDHPVAQSG